MKMPTYEECEEMIQEFGTNEGLKKHASEVTRAAVFIAKKLKEKGKEINIELVEKAALLHDLDKLRSLNENTHLHGIIAHDYLISKGFSTKLAELIKYHIIEREPEKQSWELKALRFGDAHIQDGRTASIQERMAYALKKYPFLNDIDYQKKVISQEKEVCKAIGMTPEEVLDELNNKKTEKGKENKKVSQN